jgi:hypothetical protein
VAKIRNFGNRDKQRKEEKNRNNINKDNSNNDKTMKATTSKNGRGKVAYHCCEKIKNEWILCEQNRMHYIRERENVVN